MFVHAEVRGSQAAARPAADLTIETTVVNASPSAQKCRISSVVAAPDGKTVSFVGSQSIPARQSATIRRTVSLAAAQLWSIETPRLYTLTTSVVTGNHTTDTTRTTFGIRMVKMVDSLTGGSYCTV